MSTNAYVYIIIGEVQNIFHYEHNLIVNEHYLKYVFYSSI